jgi:urea carboxylase
MELDLNLRARIHCLERALATAAHDGLVETNAGVRSVMIEYDARRLTLPALLSAVLAADASIGDVEHMVLPSRIVHLPMAFEERCVHLCCWFKTWARQPVCVVYCAVLAQ